MRKQSYYGCIASLLCLTAAGSAYAAWLPELRPEPEWPEDRTVRQEKKVGYARDHREFLGGFWWGDYTDLPFLRQAPSRADLARGPLVRTTAGQREPLLLCLRGVGEVQQAVLQPKPCLVIVDDVVSPFDVEVRRLVFRKRDITVLPQQERHVVGVPMFLPRSTIGSLRPQENTVFWLTVAVPADARPGRYEGVVNVSFCPGYSRSSYPSKRVAFSFEIDVLDVRCDPADIPFGIYADEMRFPPPYASDAFQRMYYEDMAAHDMNSMTVFGPRARAMRSGEPADELKTMMRQATDAGLVHADIPVFFGLGDYDFLTDRDTAKAFARNLKVRATELGWPELIVYGPDEPTSGEERGLEFYKNVRPPLRRGTAIPGCNLDVIGKYFDIWMLNTATPLSRELQAQAKAMQADLWTYECRWRGTNPVHNRLYAGLYTWAHRFGGNFVWAYTHEQQVYWEGNRDINYGYVIPSAAGPVPLVGWEARREGVEDYRYLKTLEHLIRENDRDPAKARIVTEAREYLDDLRRRVTDGLVLVATTAPGTADDVNVRHQWVLTVDGTAFHVYKDGEELALTSRSTGCASRFLKRLVEGGSPVLHIGNFPGEDGGSLHGTLHLVRVYDRPLSGEDVIRNQIAYNESSAMVVTGLECYLDFAHARRSSDETWYDSSGKGNGAILGPAVTAAPEGVKMSGDTSESFVSLSLDGSLGTLEKGTIELWVTFEEEGRLERLLTGRSRDGHRISMNVSQQPGDKCVTLNEEGGGFWSGRPSTEHGWDSADLYNPIPRIPAREYAEVREQIIRFIVALTGD